ncbi:UNVERIFIED_CONTAM: hypothetical protein PYX00_003484 [Menopon gallinae]|uniref:Trafficking protein particle complex subunit 10 n=1 Tax=Menopon gallinae TaxID=328185 RepID=A0AAW2I2J8_9NEOP
MMLLQIFYCYLWVFEDLEAYKSGVKDDIEKWQKSLNGADWMIILVEVYDIRKSNKLIPRTTVLDKIRQEFAVKQGDRVISLIHPIKSESKSAESWRGLVNRIRVLLLTAYNKTLSKFEETVRKNRECRQQPNWSFCNYFLMQEELALVLEMLGLYEEALVQYDELDALFTQFVLNSTKGENPKWLTSFTKPLQQWAGLNLKQKVTQSQRDLIRLSKLDLLQFRNYLFGRQCSLLLLLSKPAEMAQRSLAFLHNCVNELHILEVVAPEGAVACWIFLVCLEVLQTCEHFKEPAQVEAYSVHTAGLWSYARDKLKELGELCGLAPGPGPTSEQLHIVVGLSSGMGDSVPSNTGPTPIDKLKEALSSQEAYNNYFLELSELSISTFKHIGRMRSARLVGADLAKFYLALGQRDKAIPFLTCALSGYMDEKWPSLAIDIHLQLVECCSSNKGDIKYLTSCAAVASSELDNAIRLTYFHKFIEALTHVAQDKCFTSHLEDIGDVTGIEIKDLHKISEDECEVTAYISFDSRLPGPISCKAISVSLEKESGKGENGPSHRNEEKNSATLFKKLPIVELLNYKQDRSLYAANVVYMEPQKVLRRTESHGRGRKISMPTRHDCTNSLSSETFTLNPGSNRIPVSWKSEDTGKYKLGQISFQLGGLELLGPVPSPAPVFTIEREKSTVNLNPDTGDLIAGLMQSCTLTLHTGSYHISNGTVIQIKCSDGLKATDKLDDDESLTSELKISLPDINPFGTIEIPIRVLAELPPQREKDPTTIQHLVKIHYGWCEEETTTSLVFQAPLKSIMRLHTTLQKKFLHITVIGLTAQKLALQSAELQSVNVDAPVTKSLNTWNGKPLVIASGLNSSFLWELDTNPLKNNDDNIKLQYTMEYVPVDDTYVSTSKPRLYKCHFDLQNYKTLFVVDCELEPGNEADFCRVGTMCQLNLEVTTLTGKEIDASLMYEVLVDQTTWAVCGRAAGVITFDSESKKNVTLDVMPLCQGFLPMPSVRLSKYIPAAKKDTNRQETSRPRLESFNPGQVYTASKSRQVHVLPAPSSES